MKALPVVLILASLAWLPGCISSSAPREPEKTTVVVPPNSKDTVICSDGTKPPC